MYKTEQNKDIRIRLNANELNIPFDQEWLNEMKAAITFDDINRYPETNSDGLLAVASDKFKVPAYQIVAGNGSDELLDIVYKAFTSPGDKVLAFTPSFVMYEIISDIYQTDFKTFNVMDSTTIDVDALIDVMKKEKPQLTFICNPNNPTGQLLSHTSIERIIQTGIGTIVIDEAYGEFIGPDFMAYSAIDLIDKYDNVIVLKTLSKAYGLAGLRVGFSLSGESASQQLLANKYPYNLNQYSQQFAMALLNEKYTDKVMKRVELTLIQRERTLAALNAIEGITPSPSAGNFIWFYTEYPELKNALLDQGILIRAFDHLKGYYRVTIGTEAEMSIFIDVITQLFKEV